MYAAYVSRVRCITPYLKRSFPFHSAEMSVFCFHVVCTVYSYALCGAVALHVHVSGNVEYFAGSHEYLLHPHGDNW